MILVHAVKQDGTYCIQPAIRYIHGRVTINNFLNDLLKEDKNLTIKRFDEDHAAILSDDRMSIIMGDSSPWKNFVDVSIYWTTKQKSSFNTLCEELEKSEDYDPSFCYEL